MKLDLKYYGEHTDYSCGPVCLKMVFEHLGKSYSEKKLISLCEATKKTGTNHDHLIKEIKREGFAYRVGVKGKFDDLIRAIEAGYPVIINYLDPISAAGHYSVVTGYDKKDRVVILADPCNGNDFSISWRELKKRWHNKRGSIGWFLILGREWVNF